MVAVVVCDGAAFICYSRIDHAAARMQVGSALNGDAFRQAVIDGDGCVACNGDEQAAGVDELADVVDTLKSHAAAHIVGGVGGVAQIGSDIALLEGNRFAGRRRSGGAALRPAARPAGAEPVKAW